MARALLVLLTLAAAATPASGAIVLIPDLVGQAIALEKEGLRHATPVATRGLVERFNTLENLVVDYEYVSTPDHHDPSSAAARTRRFARGLHPKRST